MRNIRSWEDVTSALFPLSAAESALLEAAKEGAECILEDGALPNETTTPERSIRASFLRYILLGGCPAQPAISASIRLKGAVIEGCLDLGFSQVKGATRLRNCRFQEDFQAPQAHFELLSLEGSSLKCVVLARCEVSSHLMLREAELSGDLNLMGAQIGGALMLNDTRLHATGKHALRGRGLRVGRDLVWQNVSTAGGKVNLSSAHVDVLRDDLKDNPESWPARDELALNGFTYRSFDNSTTDPELRIAWLKRGSYWNDMFFPQPFTHFAKVLRETGHEADAGKVLARREHLLRKHERDRADPLVWPFLVIRDALLQRVVGYGYHPFRSVTILVLLSFLTAVLAQKTWDEGSFAPNSASVLVSPGWIAAALLPKEENPAAIWSKSVPGRDWETFNAVAYGFDVVVPLVNLGQTEAWAPSTRRDGWGDHLWWWRWVATTLGWIVTALGAAAITGIVSRD